MKYPQEQEKSVIRITNQKQDRRERAVVRLAGVVLRTILSCLLLVW